jgi:hypothetical protein
MMHGVSIWSVLIAASLIVLCVRRSLLDALIEAIENFRGGPPRPMHPSPVNDGALLRRRARRKRSGFSFRNR